jgi:tight adherence protein B
VALIIMFVVIAVFAVVALVILALSPDTATPAKLRATLDSVLKMSGLAAPEEVVDVRKNYSLSSIPWLHKLLEGFDAAVELQRILNQADLAWTPARLLLMAATGWAITASIIQWRTGLGPVCVALALPFSLAPFAFVLSKRRKRFDVFLKELPDALDLMVSSLRAGHSMVGALGMVANDAKEPIRREFRLCFEEQNFGVDLREAMANLLLRMPLPELRIIVTAILIQKESGGNLAEALEKTSSLIRERFKLRDQIKVHTAQSRFTAAILTGLPFALGTILYFQNPTYMNLLFSRPLGHKMMAVGALLNLLGLLVIRKIIKVRM